MELDVFPLCLGGNVFGWTADEDASFAVLDAYEEAEALQSLVSDVERKTGRRPETLNELRAAGLLRRRPVDGSGAPFLYDRESGTVRVAPHSPLWRPDL